MWILRFLAKSLSEKLALKKKLSESTITCQTSSVVEDMDGDEDDVCLTVVYT